MKNTLTKSAMLMTVLALSACGGGGGTSGPNPVTPPPTPVTAPAASASSAEMVAFAKNGGASAVLNVTPDSTQRGTITRTTRQVSVNGNLVSVSVDESNTGTVGLIAHRDNGGAHYRVNENAPVVANAPSGYYVGQSQMTYRLNSGHASVNTVGDAAVTLDTTAGTASYGVAGFEADNRSSVEVFGDAALVNGRFVDNGASAILRENGALFGREDVNVSGSVLGTVDSNVVAGVVSGANPTTGFELEGGFMAAPFIQP